MFDRLFPGAFMPVRSTIHSAGYDLYAWCDEADRPNMSWVVRKEGVSIGTGISVQIPQGSVGLIFGRSGLAMNHGVIAFNGVIDEDYCGELRVMLWTLKGSYRVAHGERIAQLVIVPRVSLGDVAGTVRNGGFGSTGV